MPTSSTFSTDNQYIKYRIVVTESNVSIPNNTSQITVRVQAWRTNKGYTTTGTGTCYVYIAGTKYSQSISASQEISYNSYTQLFSRTVTIQHNADGNKGIYVESKIDHQRFDSNYHGFGVSLTAIPRQANITAGADFTDEGIPSFTYSNPAGDVVESLRAGISLSDSVENPIVAYRELNSLESSYAFELTSQERDALRASMPNANTRSVFYVLETVIAGVTYYSQQEAQLSIVNGNPVASGITYEDVNSATKAITLNDQLIIQNKSSVMFTFASITAQKFADLVSVSISINSVEHSFALSGSSVIDEECNFGEIDSASNQTAQIVITDSRGNSQSYSVNILMLEWHIPTAIIKASRISNYYPQTSIMADADYSSLDGKNSIGISWEYKERTSSTYISGGSLVDAEPIIFSLDNEKSWDIRFTISDRLAQRQYTAIVEIGIPIVFFDRNKRSMGINKFPSNSSSLEIKGNTYHDGDVIFDNSGTALRGIRAVVGGSDQIRIVGGATASDQGFLELATAGDGNEPIFARQYDDDFQNVQNEITLMDANGKTELNDLDVAGDVSVVGNVNSNGIDLPHEYSENEKIVAYWIDGSPVYERVVVLPSAVSISANAWNQNVFTNPDDVLILDAKAIVSTSTGTTFWGFVGVQCVNKIIGLYNSRDSAITVDTLILKYVKIPASAV